MIVPGPLKGDTNNENKPHLADKRYIGCINEVEDSQSSIFIYDKKEQLIIKYLKNVEYPDNVLMNVMYAIGKNHFDPTIRVSLGLDIDFVMHGIQSMNGQVKRLATIAFHIKRLGQVYAYMDKYSIPLQEVEAKFLKESNKSVFYLWDNSKEVFKGDFKLIYDYTSGQYSYYHKGELQIRTLIMEEIFKLHIL
jgi:hypothetical protein